MNSLEDNTVAIAIPGRNEKFMNQTIRDILEKAEGPVEIFPILDGCSKEYMDSYEYIEHPNVHYIEFPNLGRATKRQGINTMVSLTEAKYVMSVDGHCMFEKGFDTILKRDHQPDWVQVPRRHRLDAENWCLQVQSDNRPPIDYEYIMFKPLASDDLGIHGFKWNERTLARANIPIDDIITFQGSCWFMTKEWFNMCGFMDTKFMGWGQEAEEISFQTWKMGGRVVVNKHTWYAHLHKGKKYGRMYWMSRHENRVSYARSYKHWILDNEEFFCELIERFMPMPKWPKDWRKKIYGNAKTYLKKIQDRQD